MKIDIFLGLSFIVISVGQEIMQEKSCKSTQCYERDILKRLALLEQTVIQQNKEIQKMKDTEEMLKNDMKILNDSFRLLQNQVLYPSTKAPSTPPSPTVVHKIPTTTKPSYTIPTTDHMGKEFFAMFPNNHSMYNQFLISSEQPGWAILKIPYMGIEENITVNQGSTYRNVSTAAGLGYVRAIQKKGIYVTSSVPITLYVMSVNYQLNPYISPMYKATTLGTEYISGTYQSRRLCILSTRDYTTVSLKLRMTENVLFNGVLYRGGDILNITLDYLSTFTLSTFSSIAGTVISSNYPIAVMDVGFNDFTQLLPTRDWGKLFITPKPSPEIYVPFVTPNNKYTNVSKIDSSMVYYPSFVINAPKDDYIADFGIFNANDTIMLVMTKNGWDKFLFIPPVSHYSYNHSCPLPYFYRSYTPAYENTVYILVPSHNIQGIKVNDHIINSDNIGKTTTLNNHKATQITYNVKAAHHVHVVSEFVKVGVVIVGYSIGETESYEYLYYCVS